MAVRIVTALTDDQHWFFTRYLKPSCDFFGLCLTVLLMPTPFLLRDKIYALNDFLGKCDERDIVLFTDAYDSYMAGKEQTIERLFFETGAEVLFSAEKLCSPDLTLMARYPKSETDWRFLNSGGIIGLAAAFFDLTTDLIAYSETIQKPAEKKIGGNDQYLWTRYFLDHPDSLNLDYRCRLFQTMVFTNPARELVLSGWCVKNQITNTKPIVVHFNAGSATLMDEYQDIAWPNNGYKGRTSFKTRLRCLKSEVRYRYFMNQYYFKYELFN